MLHCNLLPASLTPPASPSPHHCCCSAPPPHPPPLPLLGNQGEVIGLSSSVTAQIFQLPTNSKASYALSNALLLHHAAPNIVLTLLIQPAHVPICLESLSHPLEGFSSPILYNKCPSSA